MITTRKHIKWYEIYYVEVFEPIIVANFSKFGNLDKPGMWTKTQFVFLDKAK